MPIFAVTYRYSDDTELRMQTRPAHRDHLQRSVDDGTLLLAGARAATEPPGGLLVFRAQDRAVVDQVIADDPYVTRGIVTDSEVVEWEPGLGTLAGSL